MANSPEKKEMKTILEKERDQQINEIEKKLAEVKEYVFQLCPDQIVASLKKCKKKLKWSKKMIIKNYNEPTTPYPRTDIEEGLKKISNNNIIILILESPHTDEFAENKINGPAFGQTGKNINNYLVKTLNKKSRLKNYILPEEKTCKIIIVNAIQYACSCGINLDVLKDSMLKNVWEHDEVKEDFRNRIEIIKKASTKKLVVINCCTKPIKESVGNEIKKVFNENIYEAPHPAYWSRTKDLPKIKKPK